MSRTGTDRVRRLTALSVSAFVFAAALFVPTLTAAQVIINEVDAISPDDFIELYDGGTGSTSLDGMVVVLFDGGSDSSYGAYDLDGYTTDPSGYFLLGESGLPMADLIISNLYSGADAVALYQGDAADFPNGTAVTETGLIDALIYDSDDNDDAGLRSLLNRNHHQMNEYGAGTSAHSLQRIPNGSGGARSTWSYVPRAPTPGSANLYATLEVCSSGCSYTSIQGAVTAAEFGDVILVHPGTYVENIDTAGKPVSLLSTGGAGVTVIDGGGVARVLRLDSTEEEFFHTVIDGFTITNGATTEISFNDRDGGGIYSNGNWLTVMNSVISNNHTDLALNAFGDGGGIGAKYSHLIVTNTRVTGNQCSDDGDGGGVYGRYTSLEMEGGEVNGNNGAGDYTRGGGIHIDRGDLILSGVTVSGNGSGDGGDGGGIYFDGVGGGYHLVLSDCTITGNSTQGDGGGIYAWSGDIDAVISGCTITGNTARGGGGLGLYDGSQDGLSHFSITGSTISGNTLTGGDGGGIDVSYTSVSVSESVISDNGPAVMGGGIACSGGTSAVTITDSVVSGNLVAPVDTGWRGGGIEIGSFCAAEITSTVITGNRNEGSISGGGGIFFSGESLYLTNVTVSGNEAAQPGGGIICSSGGPNIFIVNSIFQGNTVDGVPDEIESCNATVIHSNIEGGDPDNHGQPWPGEGNVDVGALFVDQRPSSESPTSAGNYHLRSGSPAVDAGISDTFTFPILPLTDFEGHARPQGGGYDMGADEHVFKGDWNGDGMPDLFWRNHLSGGNYLWYMDGIVAASGALFPTVADTDWGIGSTADFNNDGRPDLFWRNSSTGANYLWYMDGPVVLSGEPVASAGGDWELAAVSDFNFDNQPDLLWRNTVTGENYIWHMDGSSPVSGSLLPPAGLDWSVAASDDFNGDGRQDIFWRHNATGDGFVWYMNGATVTGGTTVPSVSPDWELDGTADFNGDGRPDLCWRNYITGENYLWYMDGVTVTGGSLLPQISDTDWHIEE